MSSKYTKTFENKGYMVLDFETVVRDMRLAPWYLVDYNVYEHSNFSYIFNSKLPKFIRNIRNERVRNKVINSPLSKAICLMMSLITKHKIYIWQNTYNDLALKRYIGEHHFIDRRHSQLGLRIREVLSQLRMRDYHKPAQKGEILRLFLDTKRCILPPLDFCDNINKFH